MIQQLGFLPVLGDVYPADVKCRSPEEITARVMPRLTQGSIVILHDASVFGDHDRGATVDAVVAILAHAAKRGWRATTVSELR